MINATTTRQIHKRDLSPNRQRLIAMMQATNFGRFEDLHFRNGDPVFEPAPRVILDIKFAAENGPRPEAEKSDFALKAQVRDLFAHLEGHRSGVIKSLMIKHGLPFQMCLEQPSRE